jgi:GrpB-like predicted nucleotidyltransferase (UPF0157 family)
LKKKEIGRKINIVNYNPEWNELFIKEKNKLEGIFGDLICSIHHVGSTAIKTSKAKPVTICQKGHKEIMNMLLFVRYLNERSNQGKYYADLKRVLSKKYDYSDIAKYLEEKGVFIKDVLEKAKKEYKDIRCSDFIK